MNIIIPIVENVEGFCKFIDMANSKETNFFVGIKKSLADQFKTRRKNVEVHVFNDNAKREEIINSLHTCQLKKAGIMVVRRPLSQEEFNGLLNSNAEISVIRKTRGKFSRAIKNFFSILLKKVFSFTYFDDISAICYKESLFDLLSVCTNLSMATRINKYVGMEIEEIATNTPTVKKEYNRKKNAIFLSFGLIFFLACVASIVLLSLFVKFNLIILFVDIFFAILGLGVMFMTILNFTRAVAVGDLRFGKAVEIVVEEKSKQEKIDKTKTKTIKKEKSEIK